MKYLTVHKARPFHFSASMLYASAMENFDLLTLLSTKVLALDTTYIV